jgi:nucleoside-diphosphate-sugar epimerase
MKGLALAHRVLLTGATGFIGSHVARRLLQVGCQVAILCRADSDRWRILDILDRLHVINGDLRDLAALAPAIHAFAPLVTIHCAWGGVMNTRHADAAQSDNQAMTLSLLDAVADAGGEVFVGLGSQAEYGPHECAIGETTATQPRTEYGRAKLATGVAVVQRAAQRGLRPIWVRVFSTYGPHDQPDWLLPYVIRELRAGRRPLLTAGEQRWDYLFVADAADAIVQLALHSDAAGVFNLGSGTTHTIRAVVEMLRDLIDPTLPLGLGEKPYGDHPVMHLQADISRLQSVTGWSPRTCIQDGLRALLECPPSPRTNRSP